MKFYIGDDRLNIISTDYISASHAICKNVYHQGEILEYNYWSIRSGRYIRANINIIMNDSVSERKKSKNLKRAYIDIKWRILNRLKIARLRNLT